MSNECMLEAPLPSVLSLVHGNISNLLPIRLPRPPVVASTYHHYRHRHEPQLIHAQRLGQPLEL